jgi:uncharacterized protein YfcZ (UPF0381/DUF406 family)
MEETSICTYIDTICQNGDCSQCTAYFQYKNRLELEHRLVKLRNGTLSMEDKVKLKLK